MTAKERAVILIKIITSKGCISKDNKSIIKCDSQCPFDRCEGLDKMGSLIGGSGKEAYKAIYKKALEELI